MFEGSECRPEIFRVHRCFGLTFGCVYTMWEFEQLELRGYRMPTFGFSAYLKLICLNSRPQRTEIRKRLAPGEGGYDFHRSLRNIAHRFIVGGESLSDLTSSIMSIAKAPERNSVLEGIRQLSAWRDVNSGELFEFAPVVASSPSGVFKINYTSNFGISIGGKKVAVHIWNTRTPRLEKRFVYGALSLCRGAYAVKDGPDDLAVLSLRDQTLYRLSDVGDFSAFGIAVAAAIEGLMQTEAKDLGLPIAPSPRGPVITPLPAR